MRRQLLLLGILNLSLGICGIIASLGVFERFRATQDGRFIAALFVFPTILFVGLLLLQAGFLKHLPPGFLKKLRFIGGITPVFLFLLYLLFTR